MVTRISGFAFALCFWIALGTAALVHVNTPSDTSVTSKSLNTAHQNGK
ncbi:hypothetical protein [Hirschia maritima]|nr:hypothetical protein [Hirschia maritima]